MDVAVWLRGLGLERYATAFRDNDVDAEMGCQCLLSLVRKCVRCMHQDLRHRPTRALTDRADVVDQPPAFLPDKIEQQLAWLAEIIEGGPDFRARFGSRHRLDH